MRGGFRQTFAALAYRDYRILWFSMVGSFTGMQMQQVARGWLAYQLSGNFTAVGVVMMAWGAPQLVFSLVGGAVADRMDKRRLLVTTQAAVGALALITAVLITVDAMTIPILFVLGLVQGTVFAFNMPARQALLPELVPRERLMNAVALNNAAMNATRIVAPAVAGVLMGLAGVDAVFYLQAAVMILVVVILTRLPRGTSHIAGAERRGSIAKEIGIGLRYIWTSSDLRLLMLMAFVPVVFGMPYISLLPGFAHDDLEVGEAAFGLLSTVAGIGGLAGALGIASQSGGARLPLMQALMGLGYGLSLIGLGLLSVPFGYPGALAALVVLGLCSMGYMTLNNTMIMGATKPEFHGRVMSVYMLTFSIFPLMSGPLGVLADQTGAVRTFVFLGSTILLFIVAVIALRPRYVFGRSHIAAPAGAGRAATSTGA